VSYLEALILGVLQGATEFLPVSSSGHLALALVGMGRTETPQMTFLIAVLHLASAAAVLVYFRRDLVRLFGDRRMEIAWIALASIPAAAAGFLLKPMFEAAFDEVALIGGFLMTTGVILALADRLQLQGEGVPMPQGGPWRALAVGVAQALAILPGLSRSGLTVSAGLFSGMRREDALRFSFLLGVPAILGAGGIKILDGVRDGVTVEAGPLALALVVTFAVSLASIKLLAVFLARRKLKYFAVYCLFVGGAALAVALAA
jgi:undecaprenyl-diphosphatase